MSRSREEGDEPTETIPLVGHTQHTKVHPTTSETAFTSSVHEEVRDDESSVDVDTDTQDSESNERDIVSELEADRRLTLLSFKDALSIVTLRALLFGWIVGALVAAMNISFGLKTGWTQGGNIMAAVISMSIFKLISPLRPFTKHEANICQTTASAAGAITSTAGLVAGIPALKMLGYDYTVGALLIWAFSVSYFGVFFALPLRKPLVVKEKLAFPSGTATYETISAMATAGNLALDRGRYLLRAGLGAAAYALLAYFIPQLSNPPILQNIGLRSVAYYQWGFDMDPMLFGGGMMSGPKVGLSLAYGALIGFGIIGPMVDHLGLTPGPVTSYGTGVHGWLLWPGVTLMVCDAITNLMFLVNWKKIGTLVYSLLPRRNTYSPLDSAAVAERVLQPLTPKQQALIKSYWTFGASAFVVFVLLMTLSLWHFFSLPIWQPLIAILVTFPLSYVAVRCSGETDINPLGAIGKVTQLLFAAIAPNNVVTNLMAACVASAGASQAGDLTQDFKTGLLMQTPVMSQIIAQFVGIPVGVGASVMVYKLFDSAYDIGSSNAAPAPAANAWRAVAELLTKGLNALPPHVGWAMLVALFVGIALPLINRKYSKSKYFMWIPTASSLGLAFIVAPDQSFTIFYGAMFALIWSLKNPRTCDNYSNSLASGLIAGAGLMGVLAAIFEVASVPTWVSEDAGY